MSVETAGANSFRGPLWSVSKLNYSDAVRGQMVLPPRVQICDVTLREGGVQAGVKFTIDEGCELAQMLDDVGVAMIGLNLEEDWRKLHSYVSRMKSLNLKAKLVGSVHPFYEWKTRQADWKDVVNAQIDAGADVIEMMYFMTEWRLKGTVYRERLEPLEIVERMNEYIAYVRERGAIPFVAITDTARVDLDLVISAYTSNAKAGAGILAINDSFGAMIPPTTKFLVSEVKKIAGAAAIKVHCHNDVGLAVANSLAAVEGGAEIVDGSLNGYGDRGFADLTAIVVNLTINYGFDLGLDLGKLYEVGRAAERMTGMEVPAAWPLVGDYAFATSHELHHHAMKDQYWSGSVLDPALYGKIPKLFLTAKSGPITVKKKLEELGIRIDDDQLEDIVAKVRKEDLGRKGILSDDDIRRIVG